MITCTVCGVGNHHLAINCTSCGSYLQRRVDNLDLFDTAWKVIESPKKAFHEIAVAQHKNYGIVLSGFAGIGLMFTIFWILKVGEMNIHLFNILVAGTLTGPFVGWVIILLSAAITTLVIKIRGEKARFRNVFAVGAYALIPVVISVVTILPLEIMTYGIFLFTATPSPYYLHPTSWIIICGLDTLCGIWTLTLYFKGIKALLDVRWLKVIDIGVISLAIFAGIVTELLNLLMHIA
jgi:hypothetical protein